MYNKKRLKKSIKKIIEIVEPVMYYINKFYKWFKICCDINDRFL